MCMTFNLQNGNYGLSFKANGLSDALDKSFASLAAPDVIGLAWYMTR